MKREKIFRVEWGWLHRACSRPSSVRGYRCYCAARVNKQWFNIDRSVIEDAIRFALRFLYTNCKYNELSYTFIICAVFVRVSLLKHAFRIYLQIHRLRIIF